MERWHLPLLAAGLVTGGICTAATLVWRQRRSEALLVTAVAAAVVVAAVNETSSWWGVVAVLAAALVVRESPRHFWMGASLSLAAIALAVDAYPTEVRLAAVALVAIAAVLESMRDRHGLAASLGGKSVLLAAPVLTWVCVPDTEAMVVVGGAVSVPLLVAMAAHKERWVEGQFPFLVLLTLATADGFRGRPAGMAAAWVIAATVVGWPIGAMIRRNLRSATSPLSVPVAGAAVVVVIAGIVARTAGLSWQVGQAAMAGGAATVTVLALCVLMLRSTSASQAGGDTEGHAVPSGEDGSGPGQGSGRIQPEP